jgi:hypothetical protein
MQLEKSTIERGGGLPDEIQKQRLEQLAQDLGRVRQNQAFIEKSVNERDSIMEQSLARWRTAWVEVDKILDGVWIPTRPAPPDTHTLQRNIELRVIQSTGQIAGIAKMTGVEQKRKEEGG